jgi:Tol biopolymer transport system component
MKKLFAALFLIFCLTTLAGCQGGEKFPAGKLLFFDTFQSDSVLYWKISQKYEEPAKPIISNSWAYHEPVLSPDGKTVILVKINPVKRDQISLFVYDLDKPGIIQVIPVPEEVINTVSAPIYNILVRWSKDGKNLYFLENNVTKYEGAFGPGTKFALYTLDLESQKFNLKKEFQLPGSLTRIDLEDAFSPDFSKVLFQAYDSKKDNPDPPVIVDTATGTSQKIEWSIDYPEYPNWTPDGKNITYWDLDSWKDKICLMAINPSNGTQKTPLYCIDSKLGWSYFSAYSIKWSPSEKYLAFFYDNSVEEQNTGLVILDVHDLFKPKVSALLPNLGIFVSYSIWSPDSKWLAFFASPSEEPGFYAINTDGSRMFLLYTNPDWKDLYHATGGACDTSLLSWIN